MCCTRCVLVCVVDVCRWCVLVVCVVGVCCWCVLVGRVLFCASVLNNSIDTVLQSFPSSVHCSVHCAV